MSSVDSIEDLPREVQDRESATFDFNKVRALLVSGYFRGPTVHDDGHRGGMRRQALRGDPASHRKSILRKAVECDLLQETPSGYATTPHGYNILQQMAICDSCGGAEDPFIAGIITGRYSGYGAIFTECLSCDDPRSSTNVKRYERSNDRLEDAVRTMESNDVVCYLNGETIDQVKRRLGI